MPVRVHAPWHVELRWWWQAPPSPAASGEPVRMRDPQAARHFVASMWAHPEHASALRRFAHEGAPALWSAPEDGLLIERLAAAVAAGRVSIARIPVDRLASWDDKREEAPASAPAPAPLAAPTDAEEPTCAPCQQAAASAQALRDASADGTPFVLQD